MNDKIEISRELIERTLPCIYKSEKRGAQIAKELRQALDRRDMAAEAHAMKREGQGTGAGDALRAPVSVVHFVCYRIPDQNGCIFIECEDPQGNSINAGQWENRSDGLAQLVVSLDKVKELNQ